jgi:hypothetical protein
MAGALKFKSIHLEVYKRPTNHSKKSSTATTTMKFNTSLLSALTIIATGVELVTAMATVNSCSVSHNSSGNLFVIGVINVSSVSQSTICGHSATDIGQAASAFSTNVVGGINCFTNNPATTMSLSVTFDKQSPSVQRSVLVDGITAGFGSQGVNFDANVCNLSGIPV